MSLGSEAKEARERSGNVHKKICEALDEAFANIPTGCKRSMSASINGSNRFADIVEVSLGDTVVLKRPEEIKNHDVCIQATMTSAIAKALLVHDKVYVAFDPPAAQRDHSLDSLTLDDPREPRVLRAHSGLDGPRVEMPGYRVNPRMNPRK